MEILPGLHAVKLRSCTAYLITEERLTLIDAGLPGSKAPLVRYLGTIGRDLSELDRIICTHGHPDHIGGVRELADSGAEVLIHPDDLAGVGVTVNLLAPGYFHTLRNRKRLGTARGRRAAGRENPVGRVGEPQDVAGAALLLCSPAGAYITGQEFYIDGGLSIR